jgi:phage head maturation protease
VLITKKAFKFDVKASQEQASLGQFTGRASVYGVVDAYGDVVMPGAFTNSLKELGGRIVVLNQHDPQTRSEPPN